MTDEEMIQIALAFFEELFPGTVISEETYVSIEGSPPRPSIEMLHVLAELVVTTTILFNIRSVEEWTPHIVPIKNRIYQICKETYHG